MIEEEMILEEVALRKESVDRNRDAGDRATAQTAVALRKESVDRNISRALTFLVISWSLSARRAWIEILSVCKKSHIT